MMARAYADAFGVQNRSKIVRVDVAEVERDNAGAACGIARSVDRHAARLERRKALQSVTGQRALVLADPRHPERRQIIDCYTERDGVSDVAGAGFEAAWRI